MAQSLRLELVYDPDCPNVEPARTAIRAALTSVGAPLVWREWDRGDPATLSVLRCLGSPSVLVNGLDVGADGSSMAEPDAKTCRVYTDRQGRVSGAPSAEMILATIAAARRGRAMA
jgi:mercuric ion transport protein